MIHTRSALALAASAALAGGLAVPTANAEPRESNSGPVSVVCKPAFSSFTLTAGQATRTDPRGTPHAVPGQVEFSGSLAYSPVPLPDSATYTVVLTWRNTATGRTGTLQQTNKRNDPFGVALFSYVPTGAGRIDVTAKVTTTSPRTSTSCSGGYTVF